MLESSLSRAVERSQMSQPMKTFPSLGCCGLDCGLCPRCYTASGSKCPGCCGPGFFDKHPSCSFITCCVKKKGIEVCAQCNGFPCSKFEGWTGEGEGVYDSFLTHRKALPNLDFIKVHGIARFIEQQQRRISLLERMLRHFDEGRSKSFYCLAATLLPIPDLETALDKAEQEIRANCIMPDVKARALRELLDGLAEGAGIELRLRRKGKDDGRG